MHARYSLLSSKLYYLYSFFKSVAFLSIIPKVNIMKKKVMFTIKIIKLLCIKSNINKTERQLAIGKNGATPMVMKDKNPYTPFLKYRRAYGVCQAIFLFLYRARNHNHVYCTDEEIEI